MQQLYELVKHPYRVILTKPCAHKHRRFTWDYDYECIGCGGRFDDAWYNEPRMSLGEETVVSTFIDFEEVKAANPIAEVAKRLGLKLKKAGNALRGPCPSGEGGERALAITPGKGVWYSFGLDKGGDVLALVQLVNDCTVKEAAQFLSGTAPLEKAEGSSPERGGERGFVPLDYLQADHPAVAALGVEAKDAEALGIGYAPRGVLRGTVAVPVRLTDGTLAGYIGVTEARLPPDWKV